MRLALDPASHRVPRTKPTCLLHTWRPHRRRPFALVLHLHQHESSRNLHLQYLSKNMSTQRCQSLITQGSDHPPVLEPHMVLTGMTWRPSHEWDWHGGCTESAGFAAVHHKTVRIAWLSHKAKTGGSADGDGIWAHRETSKRRTHVGIARLASRLSELRSLGIHPMVLRREFPKCPSGAFILVLRNSSFVFRWPPYKLRGERMATTTWNPSSFAFSFSLPIFLRIF
jgi:hypothetical protein